MIFFFQDWGMFDVETNYHFIKNVCFKKMTIRIFEHDMCMLININICLHCVPTGKMDFMQNFVRKSHSTYGSVIALNGGDERNHGSADAIPMLRDDDESEANDTEMLNDIETMDDDNNEDNDDENKESAEQTNGDAADENEAMEESEQRNCISFNTTQKLHSCV